MAENVVIKIDVKADTRAIGKVRRELAALAAQAEATDAKFKKMSGSQLSAGKTLGQFGDEADDATTSTNKLSKAVDRTSKPFDRLDRNAKRANKVLRGLASFGSKALSLGFKAFAVSLGLSTAALASVSAAFKIGTWAVKAYQSALSGLFQVISVAGAGAVAVLSALAAGQREFAAATVSARYGGGQAGLTAAASQMMSLTSNTKLAVLGAKALQGAFAGVSRNTRMTADIARALTAIGDFSIASGDPEKSFAAAGEFVGQLVKAGKLTDEIAKAAATVSPEFATAVEQAKKLGLTSSKEILAAFTSGKLSTEVAGSLDTVNRTLFGTAKRNFQIIKEQFADFGTAFLPEFTSAVEEAARIFQRTFLQISGSTSKFIGGTAIDTIVGGLDRFSQWSAKTFNEYLPKAVGMFDRLKATLRDIGDRWGRFVDLIRPLQKGGQVLIDTFGPVLSSVFSGFSDGLNSFNKLIVDNKDELLAFGDSLQRLVASIGALFGEMKTAFVAVLPTLTKIVNLFTALLVAVTGVVSGVQGMFGQFGSMLTLAGFAAGKAALGELGEKKKGQRGQPPGRSSGFGGLAGFLMGGQGGTSDRQGSRGGHPGGNGYGIMPKQGKGRLGNRLAAVAPGIAMMLAPIAGSALADKTGVGEFNAAGNAASLALLANMAGVGFGGMGAWAAAPAAAGGFAGDWASGQVLDTKWASKLGGKTHSALGFGTGAAVGAGAGALVGSIVPVVGTALGAGVGAAVGGLVGGVVGFVKSGSYKKESKAAAESLVDSYSTQIQAAFDKGDMGGASRLLKQMEQEGKVGAEQAKHFDSFNDTFKDLSKELNRQTEPAIKKFNKNVEMLSDVTGKSEQEIKRLAQTTGVDLSAAITNVGETISTLTGKALVLNAADVQTNQQAFLTDAISTAFRKPMEEQNRRAAINEKTANFSQLIASGGLTQMTSGELQSNTADLLTTAFQYEQSQNNGDTYGSLKKINDMLGVGGVMYGAVHNGEHYLGEGQLAGGGDIMGPVVRQQVGAALTEYIKNGGLSNQLEGLDANLSAKGLGINAGNEERRIAGLVQSGKIDEAFAVIDRLNALNARSTLDDTQGGSREDLSALLKDGGFTIEQGAATLNSAAMSIAETFARGTRVNISVNGGGDTSVPVGSFGFIDISKKKPGDVGYMKDGDTTSARLGRTLSRHSYLNSQLAGKRTITSAWRNSNLGSINSDHVTGNAYDLTGQNLGGYQKLVTDGGGFAEFHGAGGNRHLHVVPGPTPAGDSSSPVPSLAMSGASNSGATSNSYNFTINASESATANEIAAAVMDKIDRRDRNRKERS